MSEHVADLPPPENGNLRFELNDSYSERSGRADGRSSGTSTTPYNGYLRFIMIDCCCESSG